MSRNMHAKYHFDLFFKYRSTVQSYLEVTTLNLQVIPMSRVSIFQCLPLFVLLWIHSKVRNQETTHRSCAHRSSHPSTAHRFCPFALSPWHINFKNLRFRWILWSPEPIRNCSSTNCEIQLCSTFIIKRWYYGYYLLYSGKVVLHFRFDSSWWWTKS